MATLIRLKRKKSSGNSGVVLAAGEAYYNTADKRLYIGNTDGEDVSSDSKKHIVQITPIVAGAATVKFQLGEDENNVYEKKITAEAIEGTISNAKDATNVSSTIAGTAISSLFNMSSNKPTSAKKASQADSATKATYASDNTTKSIATRFEEVATNIENLVSGLETASSDLSDEISAVATTVASNKSTTDAEITKIKNGTTAVGKATAATTASTANDVANLSLDSSSEATIKLTWGPKSEHSTSFTVSGESIGGTVTSAENVTKSINGNAITDIFSGTVAKKAAQLNTARNLTTKLDSTSSGSFNGTADVTIGVSGTLPIANGGTGATTAAQALTKLGINATATELNFMEYATGNIQGQLNHKQAKITGAATSITSSNLTASRALISNGNGKVVVSDVTSTELKYLDGVTSNIQTQLNSKSDYTTSLSCSCPDGTGGYIKICKIPMTTAYNDKTLEFTLAGRTCKYEKIIVQLQTSTPATCTETRILVSGGDDDYYQVHGYKYNTGTAGSEYIEIWCNLPSWDTVKIFRSYFYSNNSDVITWYGERTTTLPTTSSTTVKCNSRLEHWSGTAPTSHASSSTTYGAATTSNYGHVKISNGDVNTVASANGLAAGMDHSHSNYSLTTHSHSELEWKSF